MISKKSLERVWPRFKQISHDEALPTVMNLWAAWMVRNILEMQKEFSSETFAFKTAEFSDLEHTKIRSIVF
jgi:hypothetical protein